MTLEEILSHLRMELKVVGEAIEAMERLEKVYQKDIPGASKDRLERLLLLHRDEENLSGASRS